MKRSFIFLFNSCLLILIVAITLPACNSSEIGNSNDVNPETVYFDYKVWGEEGNAMATVMLQFRFAGSGGTTLVLQEPSKVELDGKPMRVDSSRMTGAYYEVQEPVGDFAGDHRIVFTDVNGKKYQENFSFQPFSLANMPETVSREDLVLEIEGLQPVDYIRVLMTDTSFGGDGVNRVDTVHNGRLLISKNEFQKLDSGPINLELKKETEREVKEGTPEGGLITVSYGLRREFILKD